MGRQSEERLREAAAGLEQAIELARGLKLLEAPEGHEDGLADTTLLPAVLDDLEVGARAGALEAEEHRTPSTYRLKPLMTSQC